MTRKGIKYQVHQSVRPTLAPLTVAVSSVLAAGTLQAATITVDTLDDGVISGQCSLRSALYAATSNLPNNGCVSGETGMDTIVFESTLSGTIQLVDDFNYGDDGSTLPIGDSVHIDGDERIIVRGSGNGQVFYAKYDGDPSFNAESVSISNLAITNGSGSFGAGIDARSRELFLSNVTLSGNTAQVGGAAVFHSPYLRFGIVPTLEIVDSTIQYNASPVPTTGGSGGAVWADLSYYARIEVDNSIFTSNSSGGQGGALYVRANEGSSLTITNNEFFGNDADATEGAGGALFADVIRTSVDISDNVFASNSTTGEGGGVFLHEDFGGNPFYDTRIADNTFSDNLAGGSGGGASISAEDGYAQLGQIELTGNNYFVANQAGFRGGGLAVFVDDTLSSVVTGAEFRQNNGAVGGGGAYISTGQRGLHLGGVVFEDNDSGGYGGGLLATVDGGDAEAIDTLFVNNGALAGGGASIFSAGGAVGVERSGFMDNTAYASFGGGLYIAGVPDRAEIIQSIFNGNTAYAMGGGLNIYTSAQNIPVEIRSSEFSDNGTSATFIFNSGGGAYIRAGDNSELFLSNSTVSGNSAFNGGGLALAGAMGAEIKYSTIADNAASSDGGGIYSDLANGCTVRNSILAGNTIEPEGDPQELSGGQYLCDVDHSLVAAADYSDYNNGTGNVLDQDPLLGPLTDNGGTGGRTHALQAGSPAIDAGDSGLFVPATDQRGGAFQRVAGNGLDMGAYEAQTLADGLFADRFETP